MKLQKGLLVLVVVSSVVISSYAFASSPAYFKSPVKARGTGCPGDNSISVSGQNTDTLSVLFDKFDAAKPTSDAASNMWRTACSFVVPVHVAPGFEVATLTADWRGYAEGKTRLHREYFFAGERGPRKTSTPNGDFSLRDNLMSAVWSGCGERVVPMRINSSVRAASTPSYIAVDTLDLKKQKIVFHLKTRRCR